MQRKTLGVIRAVSPATRLRTVLGPDGARLVLRHIWIDAWEGDPGAPWTAELLGGGRPMGEVDRWVTAG